MKKPAVGILRLLFPATALQEFFDEHVEHLSITGVASGLRSTTTTRLTALSEPRNDRPLSSGRLLWSVAVMVVQYPLLRTLGAIYCCTIGRP